MEIKDRVLQTFSAVFSIEESKLKLSDTKEDIENWDSIAQLQLIMNIEAEFGIKLNTDDVVDIDSIQKCIDIVIKLQNK